MGLSPCLPEGSHREGVGEQVWMYRRAAHSQHRSSVQTSDQRKTKGGGNSGEGKTYHKSEELEKAVAVSEEKIQQRSRRRSQSSSSRFPCRKCPNLGRDSILCCRKIGEEFSSSVEIWPKPFFSKEFRTATAFSSFLNKAPPQKRFWIPPLMIRPSPPPPLFTQCHSP